MMSCRLPIFRVAPLSLLVKRATTDTMEPDAPSVNERNAVRLFTQLGWNAMPSRPPSPAELTDKGTERKSLAMVTFGVFGKTRTRAVEPAALPPFWTTNQRVLSPGACNIARGWLNVRFENTRCVVTVAPALPPPLDFAGATHVVFDG